MQLTVLGLGQMGAGIAHHLLAEGFPLKVWNRTYARAEGLAADGAVAAKDPASAVSGAGAVLVSLSDADAVDAALFGADGAAAAIKPGVAVINTSTVSPVYASGLARRLAGSGVIYLDAALLGNPQQAREGQVRVIVAGTPPDVAAFQPVLDAIGRQVVHVGPVGLAATTKLVFNALLGAQLAALGEAVAYGVRAGLSYELLLAAISNSGFSSKVLAFRAGLAQQRQYEPAPFRTALMDKDLGLALADAKRHGVSMPLLQAAEDHFRAVIDSGDGHLDAAVLIERLARPAAGN